MSRKVVVIGAGVAGLASAITLARNGWRVTLVERSPRTAPLIRGFRRHGAYFDTGFHYAGALGPGEVLRKVLAYLGALPRLAPVSFPGDAFDRVVDPRGGREFAFPVGTAPLRERLLAAFPREGAAVKTYLDAVEEVFQAAPFVLPGEPRRSPLVERSEAVTLAGFLGGLTADPWLSRVLASHSILHGVSPGEVPFRIHASVAGSYYRSVHGLAGGGESLAEALAASSRDAGVELLCGVSATRLRLTPAGALAGVELSGGEAREAEACVATLHPSALLDLVPPGVFRPAYVQRVRGLEETLSAYILFASCPKPVEGAGPGNLIVLPGGGIDFLKGDPPIGGSPFYVAPLAPAAGGGPQHGLIAIFPAAPRVGERPPDYPAHKAEMEERMRGEVEKVVPGFSAGARLACSTPWTLRDFGASPGGSMYGAKHKVGQHNPSARTRLPGLVLAGQSTLCPGVLGAALSGLAACEQLLGGEAVRRGVEEAA